ncbi:MAG: hypothetical protein ACK46X_03225 [Candidatus Sericytochromatia bacterium]
MSHNAADNLVLDAGLSATQWRALLALVDDVADELPPGSAGILQERIDQLHRRARLEAVTIVEWHSEPDGAD